MILSIGINGDSCARHTIEKDKCIVQETFIAMEYKQPIEKNYHIKFISAFLLGLYHPTKLKSQLFKFYVNAVDSLH